MSKWAAHQIRLKHEAVRLTPVIRGCRREVHRPNNLSIFKNK